MGNKNMKLKGRTVGRSIDVSGLPRRVYGDTTRIDWPKCAEYKVPFVFDNIEGYVTIHDYVIENRDGCVYITIDNYVDTPVKIHTYALTHCQFRHLLGNKIINARPDLVKYLVNESDAYRYNIFSNEIVMVRCPNCGSQFERRVLDLTLAGVSCKECSDYISMPNKMMRSVLRQNHINFIAEASKKDFDWMQNYRYDFYFCLNNMHYLVEMDGEFHKIEKQTKRDAIKTRLASENGFQLIRVDCAYPDKDGFGYVIHNIQHSELQNILNFNLVDWNVCKSDSMNSLMIQACEMWENEQMSMFDIARLLQLSIATIRKYLQRGKELGKCTSYNESRARSRGNSLKGRSIAYIENNFIKFVFKDAKEVEAKSLQYFGVQCNAKMVRAVCADLQKTHCGLKFRYLLKEEYEQYKMINNEVVLKEAI